MRSTTLRPSGVSWAKKRCLTIRPAMPTDALFRLGLSDSGGSPCAARSPFSRQTVVCAIVARFVELGSAEALLHATAPATPFFWASVGPTSLGEIGDWAGPLVDDC